MNFFVKVFMGQRNAFFKHPIFSARPALLLKKVGQFEEIKASWVPNKRLSRLLASAHFQFWMNKFSDRDVIIRFIASKNRFMSLQIDSRNNSSKNVSVVY